jgi:hypothetical protein
MLPQRVPRTDVADHDQAGGYSNANRQRLSRRRLQPCNSGRDIERSAHGPFRIVLMRAGIAKISQYSVAPEISNEAVKCEGDTGAGSLKGIDHGGHVLGIQSCRQGGGAH